LCLIFFFFYIMLDIKQTKICPPRCSQQHVALMALENVKCPIDIKLKP